MKFLKSPHHGSVDTSYFNVKGRFSPRYTMIVSKLKDSLSWLTLGFGLLAMRKEHPSSRGELEGWWFQISFNQCVVKH
jgi:hypothetical protein